MLSEKRKLHLKRLRKLHTGKPSILKGRKRPPFSEEWKRNMSKAMKGKRVGERVKRIEVICKYCNKNFLTLLSATKRNRKQFCSRNCWAGWMSENRLRENHPNWKGNLRNPNQWFRRTKEYRLWRESVFTRDNFKCIFCGSIKRLEADHIKSSSVFPELRFAIDNGRTLCRKCHKKTNNYGYKVLKK